MDGRALKLVVSHQVRPVEPSPLPDVRAALLFDCCRCGIGRTLACLTCQRWLRHRRIVAERRAAWGAQP